MKIRAKNNVTNYLLIRYEFTALNTHRNVYLQRIRIAQMIQNNAMQYGSYNAINDYSLIRNAWSRG